jgi:hypothetical protein
MYIDLPLRLAQLWMEAASVGLRVVAGTMAAGTRDSARLMPVDQGVRHGIAGIPGWPLPWPMDLMRLWQPATANPFAAFTALPMFPFSVPPFALPSAGLGWGGFTPTLLQPLSPPWPAMAGTFAALPMAFALGAMTAAASMPTGAAVSSNVVPFVPAFRSAGGYAAAQVLTPFGSAERTFPGLWGFPFPRAAFPWG